MKLKHLIASVVLVLIIGVGFLSLWPRIKRAPARVERQEGMYEKYIELAERIIPRLWPDMNWSKEEIPKPDAMEMRDLYHVPCYTPFSRTNRIWMIMGLEDDVFVVFNNEIDEAVKQRRHSGEKPTLTIPEVINRANHYLQLLEQEIPHDHALEVCFGSDGWFTEEPAWRLNWHPCLNGVYFDDSLGKWEGHHNIALSFHEELGLIRFSRKVNIHPPPRSMEVRVTPAEAAAKAAKLALEFFKIPLYKQIYSRVKDGETESLPPISITRMTDTRLVLYEPNWALNPIRSTLFDRSGARPLETRLCWRVQFDVEIEQKPIPGMAPDRKMWLFMDAGNGKCVGVNGSW